MFLKEQLLTPTVKLIAETPDEDEDEQEEEALVDGTFAFLRSTAYRSKSRSR